MKISALSEDGPQKEYDHRALGQKLDLFSFHDIAPGAPFWHPKGIVIFRELEHCAIKINEENGYQEISTPILVKKEVFEKSGHWEYYRDNMFWFQNPRDENETLVIKPMNCPESTFVYSSRVRSFRDLPLRLAEIGRLHRNELSGTLGGLFRVRQLTMDDAHIYCAPEKAKDEVINVVDIIEEFYHTLFNFPTSYILATRPKNGLGEKKSWDMAEKALKEALEESRTPFSIAKGEGAFYGPKIEVHIKDSQGRDWQLGTAQLDLVMLPRQFNTYYIDANGEKKLPWVIHRAIFGSFERFIGILLEHYRGALPFWISPVQAAVLPIGEAQRECAGKIVEKLTAKHIRAELRAESETINKRIREAEIQKIPYILIIGAREVSLKTVAVRERGKGDIGSLTFEEFFATLSSIH